MKVLFLLWIIFFVTASAFPQNFGSLSGKIIDRINQQPVEGARIEIINTNLKAGSDENGFFFFEKVPQGIYSVKISNIGYISKVVDNIVINSGMVKDLLEELDIIKTDEIVIEDQRFQKPSDISTSFKNLSYEEIRRSPGGFEDIGRVVQSLPGVSFVSNARNDLIVRGGSPSENLFILDNSKIPNINHFGSQGSTGGPVSIINLEFIRDVNFITGGFSAKYGDKLSSVLEIKQREGSRIKFMGDINLSATGFGAVFEGPIGSNKKGSWLVSARRSYLDFIFNAAGFGFVPEYYSFQGKGAYDVGKNNFLTINLLGNYDKVKFNNDTEEKKQNNSELLQNDQKGYVTGIEWKTLINSKSFALFNLTRNYTNFNYVGRDTSFVEYFVNRSKEAETSLKAEYYLQVFKTGQLSAGIEGKYVNFVNEIKKQVDTLNFINPETSSGYVIPEINLSDDNAAYKSSAYLQWSQFFYDRFKMNIGLRYDYFSFIEKKNYLSPRVSLSLNIIRDLSFNFSYGIFYQSPSYIWLVSNPENRKLENIRADHYVGGLDYLIFPDLKASFEIYYKDYKNYPVSTIRPYYIVTNNTNYFQEQNNFGLETLVSSGYGNSKGIEFFLQKALQNNYYFNLNLSLFDAKYTALDGIQRESDYNNKILFNLQGGYLFGDGWQLSGKFRYAGGIPYTPINPLNGNQLVSEYNSARLPDYYSLDLRLDKKWSFSRWTLITYIDIQNVTGRKNISSYKWNKFKKTVETNESIGVLPSIGINAMF